MAITRQDIVDIIKGWKGLNEKDGSFKPIIDIYNSIIPLPSNYKLKYTDSWSAGTVSAAYKYAGFDDMFPCECSCVRMITKAKEMKIWVESDSYIPKLADVVMYDWEDTCMGDNTGTPDHAGLVISVDRDSMTFVVMEGDKNSIVDTRTLSVGGVFIRGFITPDFGDTMITPKIPDEVLNVDSPPTDSVINIETVGRGTLSKIAAGSELKLSNTGMYASPCTKSVSCMKTGIYYIWSVDTVNNRIRITNSKSNVGIKGQVTGWIAVNDAVSHIISNIDKASSASTPTYQVNAVYVVQFDDLAIRKGPGTNYPKINYTDLTSNAKKYDKYKNGCLHRGTKVTCMDTFVIGSNVWIKIPSGWIPAYYNRKFYVK